MRFVLSLCLVAGALPGAVFFSNLTNTGTYDGASGWSIGANIPGGFPGGSAFAVAFVPSVTGTLDSVSAGLTYCGPSSFCYHPPASNNVVLSIYASSAMNPIGGDILLETFSLAGQMLPWQGQNSAMVTGNSSLNPVLTAGTTYWMRVEVPSPLSDYAVWGRSLNSQGSSSYVSVAGGAFAFYSGFEAAFVINGTPVPEPASGWLALAALGAISRRTRWWRR